MLRILPASFAIALAICGGFATPASAQPPSAEIRIIAADVDREIVPSLRSHFEAGRRRIEKHFGRPFTKSFECEVLPSRSAFDEYFTRRLKLPKSEPWMVATGVADRMVILSPRVWKTEAQEHNPDNAEHVRDLVAHELVHVYHGQVCPKPDFAGMDDMGWFVEGLAVMVSGQLEHPHRGVAAKAIEAGRAPTKLADAWTGRHRYGVAGSIVEYVSRRFGPETIQKLMTATRNEDALKLLNITETQLLQDWRDSVMKRR
jgi:hypothetical protein